MAKFLKEVAYIQIKQHILPIINFMIFFV